MYLGDWVEDSTHDFKFTTVDGSGVPTQLAGTPVLSAYPANSTTQLTAGITLTADFDGVTGLNHVRIDTSADAGYTTGQDYDVVITTGTVDGNSVVGYVVGQFSIENRFAEVTTVAYATSLDFTATQKASINTEADTAITDASLSTFNASTDPVTVDPAQAPAVGPTPGTFDDLLLKGTTALPNASPGGPGGLATFFNVSLFKTFTVEGTPAAGAFDTNLTEADGHWDNYTVVFPLESSATVPGQSRTITSYVQANGRMTFAGGAGAETAPFTAAPTVGDTGLIVAYRGA